MLRWNVEIGKSMYSSKYFHCTNTTQWTRSSSIYISFWSPLRGRILHMCRPIPWLAVAQCPHRADAYTLWWWNLRHEGPSEPLHNHGRGKHNFGFRLCTRREKHHQKERQKEETTVRHGQADTCICSAFSHLKLLVHLLQLCHGVPNFCLQCHAALIRLPLWLPEQIHLLL